MKKYVIIIIVAVIIFLLVPPISLWIILSNVNLEKEPYAVEKTIKTPYNDNFSVSYIVYNFPIMIYVLAYSTQVKKYSMYGHLARYIMGQIWKSGWI